MLPVASFVGHFLIDGINGLLCSAVMKGMIITCISLFFWHFAALVIPGMQQAHYLARLITLEPRQVGVRLTESTLIFFFRQILRHPI